jgi:hypothetical protein
MGSKPLRLGFCYWHAFWRFPRGTIGGAENDMAVPLAAYFYYVQSTWQLKLVESALRRCSARLNWVM